MADTTDFDKAIPQPKAPEPTFIFRPGETVGEASFTVDPSEEPDQALDRWASLLLGLPVGAMALLEVIEVRAWGRDPETGKPYRYVKCSVRKLDQTQRQAAEAARQWAKQRRPRPITYKPGDGLPCAEWWPVTDTQLGKGGRERFGSTPETLARMDWVTYDALPCFHARLRKRGWQPDRIVIPLLGDLTEGVCGSYDHQQYSVTHNINDQFLMAFEAVDKLVVEACKRAPEVVLTGVASNHDQQSRSNGKSNVTDDADDRTLLILRLLADKYAAVGRSVAVQVPADPNVLVVDDGQQVVAGIHGHKPKKKGTVPNTMWEWWDRQRANLHDAGAAQVLLTAHFHHAFDVGPQGGRYLIGFPSLDNGSQFLADAEGTWSMPGVRPFVTTGDGVLDGRAAMLVWSEDREAAALQAGRQVA